MIRPLALSLLFGLALAKNYTISGISSGGFMTAQLHVIYSNYADGAAIVAGGPYYCAMGTLNAAVNQCTDQASLINVQSLVDFTNYQASIGNIDPVSGLANDKVYIFSGTNDKVVYPGVVNTTYLFYKHFIPEAQIVTNFTSPAEHAWITDNYLNNCTYLGPPWINNCNFDLADTVLTLFYGTLSPKAAAVPSNLRTFSQVPFAKGSGMAPLGFIYVPTGCDANCKLHVNFHGCSQNYLDIGNQYVVNSGLNEWAEANSIIVLYPQTLNDNGKNPSGCWDFWGYTNAFYMTHEGLQVSAVWSMTQNISSIINQ
mmetsp:Transcript_32923/g.57676  ORF Transcript_32923/g.57676 Transcript_32923/m.57676 type:complete len:313 (+) Transcript_32923:265-1203(+)